MTTGSDLPDVTLGDDEPPMARVLLVLSMIGAFGLFILHGVLFPGQALPVFGDIFSLFGGLADSGIWFFLIPIFVGFAMMLATLVGEVLED
jgi:hypothetical protein